MKARIGQHIINKIKHSRQKNGFKVELCTKKEQGKLLNDECGFVE